MLDPSSATLYLLVLQTSRRVLSRCLYPEVSGTTSAYIGATLAHSLLSAVSYTAHALTLEGFVPSVLSSSLSGPQAMRRHASALGATLLLCWELIRPLQGAAFVRVCEAELARGAGGGRAELLRLLLSATSLLACDVREALPAHLLNLSFRLIEGLAEGDATAPVLLAIDHGAGLPLWRLRFGRLEETRVAGPQPLLAALYALVTDFLCTNLRRAGLQVELYREAVLLLRRLLHLQKRSGQTLPLMRWPALWEAIFATGTFIATDEMIRLAGVAELGLELLQLVNTLAALGGEAFPDAATFESFSYELVRGHRTLELLYTLGRKQAPHARNETRARMTAHA